MKAFLVGIPYLSEASLAYQKYLITCLANLPKSDRTFVSLLKKNDQASEGQNWDNISEILVLLKSVQK